MSVHGVVLEAGRTTDATAVCRPHVTTTPSHTTTGALAIYRRVASRSLSAAAAWRWLREPHPNWQPGDKQSMPNSKGEFMSCAPSELKSQYFFGISAIVPRPVTHKL